jgi:serine/threonine protein kinase
MQTKSHGRRLKHSNKWHLRVGKYADQRSHGRQSSTARSRWSEGDFDFVDDIGDGAFGLIHLAKDLAANKYVALKEILNQEVLKRSSIKTLQAEVQIQTRYDTVDECEATWGK